MINHKWTYDFKRLFALVIVWELLFWCLWFLVIESNVFFTKNVDFMFMEEAKLAWLCILIPLIAVFLYNAFRNEQVYLAAGEKVRKTIFKPIGTSKAFVSWFLFRNGITFLIIALAQPSFGEKSVEGTTKSMEVVVCLDVSNSMNTKDVDGELSRLAIAKRAINELINKLGGEKIGISIFAADAYTQLPLTLDYAAAKMFVNDISTNMLSAQGTNIKNALENAHSMFSEQKKMSKVVILVTDGENHDEDPAAILKKYTEDEIQLGVLGIGTAKGGLIPVDPEDASKGYKRNAVGMTVQSRLNPNLINDLADKANGVAVVSNSAYPDLRGLLKQMDTLKRSKVKGMDFKIREQRYQFPLGISIICFVLYMVWTSGSWRLKDVFIR